MDFLYSIIIPHYNSPDLLARMLKSIPEREDIQVIVVDDCSMVEDVAKLKTLKHKNLELYLQTENHGAGYARNVGLDHAKGKWVLVVDADDIFADYAFDVLDKYKDSDIDYLCYCVCMLKEDGKTGRKIISDESVRRYLKFKDRQSLNLFKFKNTVCWNKMVSREFLIAKDIRFECCGVNNDVYYNLAIGLKTDKFEVIPDVLYHPIEVSNSITHKKRSVEREYEFFIQTQKRNGLYQAIGLKRWPFYKYTFLYIPFLLKKHGGCFTIKFFIHYFTHLEEIRLARLEYVKKLGLEK